METSQVLNRQKPLCAMLGWSMVLEESQMMRFGLASRSVLLNWWVEIQKWLFPVGREHFPDQHLSTKKCENTTWIGCNDYYLSVYIFFMFVCF